MVDERFRPAWDRTVLVVSALASLALVVLIDYRYGPGLSPDSAEYVAASTSLLKGEGLQGLDGHPLVRWPPLFPAAMGAASAGLLEPALAGGIVNGLAFAGTVVLGIRHLRRIFHDSIVAVGGSIAILLGPPLLLVATFVWAEAVFVLLTLLCLLRLAKYLQHGRRSDLLLAAFFAGLAAVTRYAGLALILTGLVVLTIDPNASKDRKVRSAGTFLGISAIPFTLYVFRNLAVSSTVMGAWGDPPATGSQVIEQFAEVTSRWFLPPRVLPGLVLALAAVAVVASIVIFRGRTNSEGWTPVTLAMAVFLAVYSTTLIASELLTLVNIPTDRLLAPIYVPVVFLLVTVFARLAGRIPVGRARLVVSVVLAGFLCAVPLQRAVQRVSDSFENGAGWYATTTWQESELVRELRIQGGDLNARLFTNDSAGLYLVAGITGELSAAIHSFNSEVRTSLRLMDLAAIANSEPSYLIWFDFVDWAFLETLDGLRTELELVSVVSTGDGSIYRLDQPRD